MRAQCAVRLVAALFIGALALGWLPLVGDAAAQSAAPQAAQAATPGEVALDDVTIAVGGIAYRAPRLVFRGTPLSRTELLRLVDPASSEAVAERVARLQAAEIVAPEVVAETTTPQGVQRTTYRDVLFTKVGGGRIGSVTATGGSLETRDGVVATSGRFDRFSIEELDLGRTFALFAAKVGTDSVLQRIYGAFSLEGLTLTDGGGITTRIGRLAGRDLSAKPTASGWMETMAALSAAPDMKTASPEARRRSIAALAELSEAFQLGLLEATDITFGPETGRTGSGAGRIGRIGFSSAADNRGGGITIDGFEMLGGDGRVRFDTLAFGGLSLRPILDAMQDQGLPRDGKMSPAGLRSMLPALGNVRIDGLEFDMATGGTATGRAGTRVSLGQFALAAAKPIEGLPSDLRLTLRNVALAVPPNSENDAFRQLAALGYERVDASLALNLGWNEPGQELVIREIAVEGADMGGAVLRAVIGNVGRDVFDPDSALASVAALGAAAKSAEITVENRGLFERYVAREARRQRRSPEDVRREYGTAAMIGIPAILGSAPAAKTLAQAVARFVAKPGKLTIRARAKQPGGYGIADFTAGSDPASVLNALEITATAE